MFCLWMVTLLAARVMVMAFSLERKDKSRRALVYRMDVEMWRWTWILCSTITKCSMMISPPTVTAGCSPTQSSF